jgi:hypothetical protein
VLFWWMGGPRTVTGWEALASVPLGTKDSVPSNVFHYKWSRSGRWFPPGALPPKMACLSTLKTCPQVWTLPQGSLSECSYQSLQSFIFFLSLSRSFFSFSKSLLQYYSMQMWLHGPRHCLICWNWESRFPFRYPVSLSFFSLPLLLL